MMSAVDRSFTDQSTLQEDERLGLSFMDTHGYSPRGECPALPPLGSTPKNEASVVLLLGTGPGKAEEALVLLLPWKSFRKMEDLDTGFSRRNSRSRVDWGKCSGDSV